MRKRKLMLSVGLCSLLILTSCDSSEERILPSNRTDGDARKSSDLTMGRSTPVEPGTYTLYGSSVPFNGTKVRSYVNVVNYRPAEIGYLMSNAAFNNLPNPGVPENTEILIPLPDGLRSLGVLFDHLTLHWFPQGSPPEGVYTVPKFDFHCYTIPLSERMAIDHMDPAITIAPDPLYTPLNYLGPIGPMSAMGSHWVDLQSPEFTGGTFTKTFIYGSFNGKIIFEEPSITLAYLRESVTINDVIPIRQPGSYQRDGFYPLKYGISKNSSTTRIYLSDFVYYSATGESEI